MERRHYNDGPALNLEDVSQRPPSLSCPCWCPHSSLPPIQIVWRQRRTPRASRAGIESPETIIEVNPRFLPPEILGRHFWNMLLHSTTKAMEKHVLTEAMVRDAATCYWIPDLCEAGGDRLAVNGDRLLKLRPDPRVPFMVYAVAGRPPFRCMDDFRVDNKVYEKWKGEHPNFLGFWTGVEWDNEYITPLGDAKHAEEWAAKHGCSETALRRMQEGFDAGQGESGSRGARTARLLCCAAALLLRRSREDDLSAGRMVFRPLRFGIRRRHGRRRTTNTGAYRHQVSMFHIRGAASPV